MNSKEREQEKAGGAFVGTVLLAVGLGLLWSPLAIIVALAVGCFVMALA